MVFLCLPLLLIPPISRGFTFPHRFAMNSSHSHCSWESLLCPHTWAVLVGRVEVVRFETTISLLGFWFLFDNHAFLVGPLWQLSHAGPWPSSGLSWWWRSLKVMWHGLGCLSTLFHILSAISSPPGYLEFAYLTEDVWRSWAQLIHSLQVLMLPIWLPSRLSFHVGHPVSLASSLPLSDKPLWAPFSKRKAVRGSRNSAN